MQGISTTPKYKSSAASWWREMNRLGAAGVPFLFLLDYALEKPIVLPLADIDTAEIGFRIGQSTNTPTGASQNLEKSRVVLHKSPITFEAYQKAFAQVLHEIKLGNSFLLNLTIATPISSDLDLRQIFEQTKAKYCIWKRDDFVCFSPEIFVRIDAQGQISSHPMKGTIDATLPDAAAQLLDNEKETAEHYTIVDLIRNDLSRVAINVQVEQFRYLDTIKTHQGELLQASSKIKGQLPKQWRGKLGSIFKKLLPAGSITGAPKLRTTQIIAAAEAQPRGYYTGICGVFDGETLDSGVMIRFIEQDTASGQLVFRSGGGITCMSDARSEYEECVAKVYLPLV